MLAKNAEKPTEKEIIIDVPLALELSAKGLGWPVNVVAVRHGESRGALNSLQDMDLELQNPRDLNPICHSIILFSHSMPSICRSLRQRPRPRPMRTSPSPHAKSFFSDSKIRHRT